MAIYHFTTKIVRAGKGKCAVASAAYQSAEMLYDEKLGQNFSYKHKEEVIHKEILLPKNAPEHLKDRQKLWNEVESIEKRSNAQYARSFEMALPKELTVDQQIELSRTFIQKEFVDRGMIADWALHEKQGNPHIHVMTTTWKFTQKGTWAQKAKTTYALDENGNKIPMIDPKTGKQKVRIRKGKGEELVWKRVNVPATDWDKRQTLIAWRKAWEVECNRILETISPELRIDHRSYAEQGIEKMPTIHEGYKARRIEAEGGTSERMELNRQIKNYNVILEKWEPHKQEIEAEIYEKPQTMFLENEAPILQKEPALLEEKEPSLLEKESMQMEENDLPEVEKIQGEKQPLSEAEIERLTNELHTLQAIYREKYAAGGSEILSWQKRKTEIDKEAHQLKAELRFIDAEIEERGSFKHNYDTRLSELRAELEALPPTAILRKRQLADRIKELEKQPAAHLDRLTEKIHRHGQIEARLSELTGETKQLQDELKTITEKRTRLEAKIKTLRQTVEAVSLKQVLKPHLKIKPPGM